MIDYLFTDLISPPTFRKRKLDWNFACKKCISPNFNVKKECFIKKKEEKKVWE